MRSPLIEVQVHRSALKRGLSVEEVIRMWVWGFDETTIDDGEPPRCMRLAFDGAGQPWEMAALKFAGGARVLVIHAMPARKSVIAKMQRRMR